MKRFHKAWFLKKETDRVNVVKNLDKIDSEIAVDNWKLLDPSIVYEVCINVNQNLFVCFK